MTLAVHSNVTGRLSRRLAPVDPLSERERGLGMSLVFLDGLASQAMETLVSGVFLTAFAIVLGASNLIIGVLAAIPSLAQLMQMPGVVLVERLRARRLIAVMAALVGRGSLVILGAGIFLPSDYILPLLVVVAVAHAVCGSIVGCSWNSWMRDLLPPDHINRFFARRMMYATLLGAFLSFGVAHFLGIATTFWPQHTVAIFSAIAMAGGIAGLIGVAIVWQTPEPQMPQRDPSQPLRAVLAEPFKVKNFKQLMLFLAARGLSANIATPFFTVYMLKTLNIDLANVTLLIVVSQLANVASVQMWARIADRFSNKTVLRVSGQLFVLSLVGWVFTGNPGPHAWTQPLLYGIHILMGISMAGVTLAAASIALKLSPPGQATAFLAVNTMISAVAGGIAPIIGGAFADVFATRELGITIHWMSPAVDLSIPALQMRHWQFFFVIAVLTSLYALSLLKLVRERGDVSSRVIVRRGFQAASQAAGVWGGPLRLRWKGRMTLGLAGQKPSTSLGHGGGI